MCTGMSWAVGLAGALLCAAPAGECLGRLSNLPGAELQCGSIVKFAYRTCIGGIVETAAGRERPATVPAAPEQEAMLTHGSMDSTTWHEGCSPAAWGATCPLALSGAVVGQLASIVSLDLMLTGLKFQ